MTAGCFPPCNCRYLLPELAALVASPGLQRLMKKGNQAGRNRRPVKAEIQTEPGAFFLQSR
jgi:hypothetical protein